MKNDILENDYKNLVGYNEIITHNLRFHIDEILAICLVFIMRNSVCGIKRISRNKEIEHNENSLLIDIGGEYNGINKFDHHQDDQVVRTEKYNKDIQTAYSSAGLIWKTFGKSYCIDIMGNIDAGIEVFNKIDRELIYPIDCHDCGTWYRNGDPFNHREGVMFQTLGIEKVVAFFNSDSLNEEDQHKAFLNIIEIIFRIVKRYLEFNFKNARNKIILENIFSNYNGKDEYILVTKGVNGFWRAALQKNCETWKMIEKNCKVVIFQSDDGYYVSSIPEKKNGKLSKYIFRKESENYRYVSKDRSQVVMNDLSRLEDVLRKDVSLRNVK